MQRLSDLRRRSHFGAPLAALLSAPVCGLLKLLLAILKGLLRKKCPEETLTGTCVKGPRPVSLLLLLPEAAHYLLPAFFRCTNQCVANWHPALPLFAWNPINCKRLKPTAPSLYILTWWKTLSCKITGHVVLLLYHWLCCLQYCCYLRLHCGCCWSFGIAARTLRNCAFVIHGSVCCRGFSLLCLFVKVQLCPHCVAGYLHLRTMCA